MIQGAGFVSQQIQGHEVLFVCVMFGNRFTWFILCTKTACFCQCFSLNCRLILRYILFRTRIFKKSSPFVVEDIPIRAVLGHLSLN